MSGFRTNLDGELAAVDHAGHVVRIERDALGREIRRALPGGAALVAPASKGCAAG
jgi:YD repeat-containing protein